MSHRSATQRMGTIGASCMLLSLPLLFTDSAPGDPTPQDVMVLIDQQRSVSTSSEFYSNFGETCFVTDSDSAPNMEPFAGEVSTVCFGGESLASQHSEMSVHGFSMIGRVTSTSYGDDFCGMAGWEELGAASSHFGVTFELTAAAEMTTRIYLDTQQGVFDARIVGPSETLFFTPGERRTDEFAPGTYQVLVDANVDTYNGCPNGVPQVIEAFDYAFRFQPCPEDLDSSGDIGVTDLMSVLGMWGECGGCDEDLDVDGSVNVLDLLLVLSSWGTC